MRKLLVSTAAIGLVLGLTAAQADPNDHHDNKYEHHGNTNTNQQNGHTGGTQGGPQNNTMHGPGGNTMMGPQNNQGNWQQNNHSGWQQNNHGNTMMGPQNNQGNWQQNNHSGWQQNNHGNTMMGPNNNRMMGGHRAVDFTRFHGNIAAQRRFHIGVWHAPRDYRYRRWTFGERLPALFFVRDYWLQDWGAYDLMPPPDGCMWVRYGPDALLVDLDSGEVIRVVYGVFY